MWYHAPWMTSVSLTSVTAPRPFSVPRSTAHHEGPRYSSVPSRTSMNPPPSKTSVLSTTAWKG